MNNVNSLCPGCFKDKDSQTVCPHCGFDEGARMSPIILPYRTLLNDQYLSGKVLGKPGGFGITYLGWDTRLETCVAIKEFLPRDIAGRDYDRKTIAPHSVDDAEQFKFGLEQFLNEAKTLAKIDHANVVRIRNFFEQNGTAYIVMDYYDGVTLEEFLNRQGGKISEKLAVDIMMPILDGLREVHAQGFLHRDIKPQNIYLTQSKRPILLDFGAARYAFGERTRSLSVMLTPGYSPYEQYQRNGRQGPWTDIYACGATLYKMVTGEAPPEAIEREKEDTLISPYRKNNISTALNDAIMKSMRKDPIERPVNIETFQKLLVSNGGTRGDYNNTNSCSSTMEEMVMYAGFWKRVAAWLIDLFITGIGVIIIGLVFGPAMISSQQDEAASILLAQTLAIMAIWVYFAVMESSSTQGTLGKMALGIKVTDTYGNRIGFGKASGRFFGKMISGIVLGIGFLMVAFTEKKQGLHDIMADCLVVNKNQ